MDLRKSRWNWKSNGGGKRIERTNSPFVVIKPSKKRNKDALEYWQPYLFVWQLLLIFRFYRRNKILFWREKYVLQMKLSDFFTYLFELQMPCNDLQTMLFLVEFQCHKIQYFVFVHRIWNLRFHSGHRSKKWSRFFTYSI